jgi:hypothetical protein
MNDDAALAYTANGALTALAILANCLKNQGALGSSQYEDALRRTIEADGAQRNRPDYQFLKNLLNALEGKPPSPSSATH